MELRVRFKNKEEEELIRCILVHFGYSFLDFIRPYPPLYYIIYDDMSYDVGNNIYVYKTESLEDLLDHIELNGGKL